MEYKKNAEAVYARLYDFFSSEARDRICAKMHLKADPAEKQIHNVEKDKELNDIEISYPDFDENTLAEHLKSCKVFQELSDDSFPFQYPWEFDQGLYGALVGGRIKFSDIGDWVSSMVYPFVDDLDEIKNFKLDENHIWYKRYKDRLALYVKYLKGKIAITDVLCISGVNFLFDLVGATEAYYAILETPDKAKQAIDFSIDLNIWLRETFFQIVGLENGGTFINSVQNGMWIPGRVVNESVDPFHLTSADTFEEWGRGPLEKMFGHFDGGCVHLHGNGRHLLKSVSSVKGMKMIMILEDHPFPFAYEVLDELASQRGCVPIQLRIPYDIFVSKLSAKQLPANIYYFVEAVPDIATANELMKEVIQYRA